ATGHFQQTIRNAIDDELITVESCIAYFESKGILKLCLKIRCPHCLQYPAYALGQLANSVVCKKCRRSFDFPIAGPPNKWCYRPVGPFAIRDFAMGAFSVFLSLRFLTDQLRASTTCVPSCELLKEEDEPLEADFICFWQNHSWRYPKRLTVLGECKCLGD